MKTKFKYISIIFALMIVANIACTDYLLEDNKTGATEEVIYSTKSGLDGLLASSYSYLRGWYGKEAAYGLSEGGTDIWLTGYDNRQKVLIDYSGITPEVATSSRETMNACFDEYWELFYTAVNTCNTGIKYVEEATSLILSEADKTAYIGELKALRAFYYWHLVETWGPVQINREPVSSASTIAHRDTEEDVYAFILEDIDDAIVRLAGKTSKTGHINLWAAKALRARFLLYKASKFNDNQAYLGAAAEAEEVIGSSGLSFFTNYSDCWKGTYENGLSNKEVVWWIDYSDVLENNILPKRLKLDANGAQMTWSQMILRNAANTIGGNAAHLMFVGVWNSVPATSAILKRTDTEANKNITYKSVVYNAGTSYQAYSKGFTRFVPSGYLLDLFNSATDQRYQASFRDVYYVAPAFTTAFSGGIAPPSGYALMRDTALYLSRTTVTASQIARAATRYVLFSRTDVANPLVYPLYQDAAGTLPTIATGTTGNENYKGNRMYIQLKKFDDLNGSIIRDLGSRDAFVIRLSELYLIAAEGYMMSGQSGPAITKLNALRNARAIAGKSNVLSPAEETQVGGKDINVILDERARELCGEQQRWFDLKRTGKLVERIKMYNGSAKDNIQSFHTLRPIPTPQLDAITNRTSGPDPNGFWQNTGY
ncbi:MAG: RagB/SusD family nutrient uptake outer membrane protein [Bacteroidales bacterium]|nr:RagB/SusD family nutrient uptake outer membrane protein [Bacteroidales bacterium]